MLDVFCDSAQEQQKVIENPANLKRGLSFILVEPKPYSEYIEKILGEINKRLVDKSNDITDI